MNKNDYMYKLENGSPTAIWAYERIRELEEWVEIEGINNDTCTRRILGKVCSNCQCPYGKE